MLEKRDWMFAFALHVTVVLVIYLLNQWQVDYRPMPERTMQVNMVTLEQLQEMVQQAKAGSRSKPKRKESPKKKSKSKPRAVLNPQQNKRKQVDEEELDYDPFAPLESVPTKVRKKSKAGDKQLQEMLKGQLSEQELNRYIAGMQKAVEQKWKVPMEMMDRVKDALVELKLYRNGQVASIRILESSGSPMLDETLKQAIYAAAPFELPAKQFELFRSNQIRFFPLK